MKGFCFGRGVPAAFVRDMGGQQETDSGFIPAYLGMVMFFKPCPAGLFTPKRLLKRVRVIPNSNVHSTAYRAGGREATDASETRHARRIGGGCAGPPTRAGRHLSDSTKFALKDNLRGIYLLCTISGGEGRREVFIIDVASSIDVSCLSTTWRADVRIFGAESDRIRVSAGVLPFANIDRVHTEKFLVHQ